MLAVSDYLERVGLDHRELRLLLLRYPHVLVANRLKNLLQLMRALDLHDRFSDKIMSGDHHLLTDFVADHAEKQLEKDFLDVDSFYGFATWVYVQQLIQLQPSSQLLRISS